MNWDFLLTSLIVAVIPGTGVVYTLSVGLGRGFAAAVLAALGCTLGIVPHLLATMAGLAALLHASALAFQIVKFAGVLFLLYMAWNALREGGALNVRARTQTVSAARLVRDGIALNILNPKLSVFFLAFLPQFVTPGAPGAAAAMSGLAAVFMAITFAVFVVYGAAASATRDFVVSRPAVMAWMRRCFAAAFALLGARLALAER